MANFLSHNSPADFTDEAFFKLQAMSVSLIALLDDISTILDDVALLTKVAAKKTAGVLGDDLARIFHRSKSAAPP